MKAHTFIPCGDIPKNGPQAHYTKFCGQELEWLGFDTQSRYRSIGGHPIYGEHDITYKLNSYGYRCPEFTESADIRVISIGDSFVIGKGLPQHAIFHEIVCDQIRHETGRTVINWNLGSGGASNDYIVRTLFLAVPLLQPHFVMVNFAERGRHDYFTVLDEWFKFVPTNDPNWFDPTLREIHNTFLNLRSLTNEAVRLFQNYKSVEALLRDQMWLFSVVDMDVLHALEGHYCETLYTGTFEVLDTSRDGVHPGPISHNRISDAYIRKLDKLGWMQKLAQLRRPASSSK